MNVSESYYLKVNDQMRGPYTIPQLRHMYLKGLVAPETPYWQDGMKDLRPVRLLFQHPPLDMRALLLKWGSVLLGLIIGCTLVVTLWRDRIDALLGSGVMGQFFRKFIYIWFYKKD